MYVRQAGIRVSPCKQSVKFSFEPQLLTSGGSSGGQPAESRVAQTIHSTPRQGSPVLKPGPQNPQHLQPHLKFQRHLNTQQIRNTPIAWEGYPLI